MSNSNFDIDDILAEFMADTPQQPRTETPAPKREPAVPPVYESRPQEFVPPREEQTYTQTVKVTPERQKPEYSPEPKLKENKVKPQKAEEPHEQTEAAKPSALSNFLWALGALVLALVAAVTLCWSVFNIHPDASAEKDQSGSLSRNAVKAIDKAFAGWASTAANTEGGEQGEVAAPEPTPEPEPERIIYTIPEGDVTPPAPNSACYGSCSIGEAYKVMDIIAMAEESGLLEGQDVIFTPDANFYWDSNIQYYLDDSIMTICWKEWIEGRVCSCAEVKVADASQFRRQLAGGSFGSSNTYYATEIARSVNAVVAMNADYYLFRDFGIVVNNRQVYRFNEGTYTGSYRKYNCIDTCFVTSEGEFKFIHRLEEYTYDEICKYVEDNDIIFSIAFGPVVVEDGVLQHCDWYPAGEVTQGYSRAAIGQYDRLHYLYMTVSHHDDSAARCTVDEFGAFMFNKGVKNAYNLDGGQTGEVVFNGVPYNNIDFGAERLVSDIIYFATAIPEGEG